ncbi:MAG: DmsE family decaheme c-type cytochrome [Gammaproteobacteria bacterium]|nr:DmsE family decaheme c-type cytochrome [Gammaproteobacteria bacterium]
MIRLRHITFIAVLILIAMNMNFAQAKDDMMIAKAKPPAKDIVLTGDAECTSCHDEEDSPEQLAIGKTRHGTRTDKRGPTCTSCHGDSETHINKPKGQGKRDKPEIIFGHFGKGTDTPVNERNAVCLDCHTDGSRIHWAGSTHSSRDVACTNCHQVHTAHDKVRDKQAQTELCFNCHKEQRAQMHRPSHHPVPEGQMSCSDCHSPHGSAGTKQLAKDSVNETCFTCHMEKRGPFIHNHQPVTEDCTICHNPHGTTIAKMLKSRPPFLCQECHSHTSHPTQNAALPDAQSTSTRVVGTVGRGCLNCHTNIHGGNSTQNSATAGRFRR